MISSDTSNIESAWKCQKCPELISVDKIGKVTKAVKEASEKLDVDPNITEHEKFLKKYSELVHENHVLLIGQVSHQHLVYQNWPQDGAAKIICLLWL